LLLTRAPWYLSPFLAEWTDATVSYWGKILGGMAGFAMGGPLGAMLGAALGHAADGGGLRAHVRNGFGFGMGSDRASGAARIAAMFGRREQLFAVAVVVLSAKLAKCDAPVNRLEIDAFKRHFRLPPESMRDIGRLFDQARDSPDGFEGYADQLGEAFYDNRGTLEDVLVAFIAIARADGPVNQREFAFLRRVHLGFGLDEHAWERAIGNASSRPQRPSNEAPDPYGVLGLNRQASDEALRARWKQLMRENHPDSLAARGVPESFIKRANDKVATINAAWDQIKRERGL
jgi:DnaJ like chaperone protein